MQPPFPSFEKRFQRRTTAFLAIHPELA